MPTFLVIGNLKMNLLSHEECTTYLSQLRREAAGKDFLYTRGIVAPPALYLPYFENLPKCFSLGAQNMGWESKGAYTGEISPVMLRNAGVEYVIIGHSERRLYAGENDRLAAIKVKLAFKEGLIPILCLGETEEERNHGQTMAVIERTIQTVFRELSSLLAERVIIAYEPRWAIGSGHVPSTSDILQVKVFLRKLFSALYTGELAEKITVLYGGSVKTAFLSAVSWEAEMNGVLVGGESLYPRELIKMMSEAESHLR